MNLTDARAALRDRTIFLEDVPRETARARFEAALAGAGFTFDRCERIALDDALGRVTSEPVFARLSSPHYHACAMDGIAVTADTTVDARDANPVVLQLGDSAHLVDTGDPLPRGTDAVIPVEEIDLRADGGVAIRSSVAPFAHVRAIGEDVVATETVVAAQRTLEPADLAAIAGAGLISVAVWAVPKVAVITTGSELVSAEVAHPAPGEIVDSNAVLLRACVRRYGGEPVSTERVPDDPERLRAVLEEAIGQCDAVVVNAGSSAGSEDFTARLFASLGIVAVHGVAIRPGHPLVLGVAKAGARAVPLLGIPGYPVSAAICADLFLRPLLERMTRRDPPDAREFDAVIARKLFSPLGEEEFVRAVAARVGDRLVATPLRRGAGVITSLSRANCLIVVPQFSEGVRAGETVRARALRPQSAIERTLLAVGSHDVAMDILAGHLAAGGLELVSANVGSIGGIAALADGATHIAGTHAIEAATGEYNDWAVRRYATGVRIALVSFVHRSQGLIVAPGNPLGLRSLRDVAERRARYVNRQRDAGTRMLLDLLLAREALVPQDIAGYDRLEFTHLAVAALVAEGSADCGLGILAAARALGCDFVPLAEEPYELAMLAVSLDDPRIAALVESLRSPELHAEVRALGGYDLRDAGAIRIVE